MSKDGSNAPAFGDVSGAVREPVPIDDDWRIACRERMDAVGWKQKALAVHIGCVQANISQTLKVGGQRTSEFADAISLAIGVPLPAPGRLYLAARLVEEHGTARDRNAVEGLIASLESLARRK